MPHDPACSRRIRSLMGGAAIGLVLALAAPAPAVMAQGNVTAENIRHARPGLVVEIPRIEATGANVSAADLKALFAGEGMQPVADRLSRLDARSIRIPTLTMTQVAGDQTTTTVYRDILLDDVRAGRIARVTSPGGTIRTETRARARATQDKAQDKGSEKNKGAGQRGKPEVLSGTFGATSVTGLDAGFMLRLYTQPAPAGGTNPVSPVYDAFSTENIVLSDGRTTEFRLARVTGQAVRARLGQVPWLGLIDLAGEMEALDEDDDKGRLKIALRILSIFDGLEIGETALEGFVMRAVDKSGKPVTVQLASLSMSLPASGEGAFEMKGFEVGADDARIRMGSFALRGFSLGPTIAALREAAEKPGDDSLGQIDPAKLMPYPGSWTMRDLDFDVPAKERDKSAERMRVTLRGFEFAGTKPLNGVPTAGRMAIENLRIPIPKRDPNFRDLAAMGYTALDASATMETDWNARTKELEISNLAVNGVDMGSFNSRILLGNAGEGLFARDSAMNQIALVQLTFKAFDMRLQDKGLFGRLIAHLAAKQNKTPDALRAEYGMAAALAIPAMLGNTDAAKKVGAAVAQFIGKPGVLSISARSRNPAGIGLPDLGGLSNPSAILDAIDLDARAE